MTNTLVAIGYLGGMRVYLNVPREEAERRFHEETGDYADDGAVKEIEFGDVFEAYDIWEASESIPDRQARLKREQEQKDGWGSVFD